MTQLQQHRDEQQKEEKQASRWACAQGFSGRERKREAANITHRRLWERDSRVINRTQAVRSPLSWTECAFVTAAYSPSPGQYMTTKPGRHHFQALAWSAVWERRALSMTANTLSTLYVEVQTQAQDECLQQCSCELMFKDSIFFEFHVSNSISNVRNNL